MALDFALRSLGFSMNFNAQKYREIAQGKGKSSLLTMRRNALSKKNASAIEIVEKELDRRFPSWRSSPQGKSFKKLPTRARFQDEGLEFETQIGAYLWLLEQFIGSRPDILEANKFELDFVTIGNAGRFIALDPMKLWRKSKHLLEDGSNHTWIGKYCVNKNLSFPQKTRVLMRYAAFTDWEYKKDWLFERISEGGDEMDLTSLLD